MDHYKSYHVVITDFIAIYLIYDFCFYIFHRIIHHPRFYSSIHKLHHNTFADIALSANYMTVADYFLEIIIPYWIATTVWNSCFLASFLFAIIGNINGLITHGGYNFMFMPNPYDHQEHHIYFNKNYGTGGPWDYLLSTGGREIARRTIGATQ